MKLIQKSASSTMSAADVAAHEAASFVRSNRRPVESDPTMDEALRRVRDHRDAIREGLAAARAYAASVAA